MAGDHDFTYLPHTVSRTSLLLHLSAHPQRLGCGTAVADSQAALEQARADLRASKAASQRQGVQAEAKHAQQLWQVRGFVIVGYL